MKYTTPALPEGTYLKKVNSLNASAMEVKCEGFYNDGKREKSLDGYYFKADLILKK